jgi:hypothetical protein
MVSDIKRFSWQSRCRHVRGNFCCENERHKAEAREFPDAWPQESSDS